MSDTDTFWRDQLERLALDEDTGTVDVREDIARGRARLVRTRLAVVAAGVLAGAVVLGTGLALGGGSNGSRQGSADPAGEGPTAAATYHEPETTLAPSPAPTGEKTDAERAMRRRLNGPVGATSTPFKGWRNELFRTTQSVLDPGGRHLDYSTQSLQSGDDEEGVSLGIKMGWSNPGASGEGMVQVQISTESGSDEDLCGLMGGFECPRTVLADGVTLRTGTSGSSFVVLYRQPDGERVLVLVDRLFGNNSQTPVKGLGITLGDVYRYVQDDRLNLPR